MAIERIQRDQNTSAGQVQQALRALKSSSPNVTFYVSDLWLPIESAPKDGSDIIVLIPEAGSQAVDIARWESFRGDGAWHAARCADGLEVGPVTHWMPLPVPPKGGA
jgi:cell wall assembly regulator SMI1